MVLSEFTEPTDAPDLSRFRLVETVFTSCTDGEVKLQIIKSFCAQSPLRIVCVTIAFGMGIDCPDFREVVHLGAPNDNRVIYPRDRTVRERQQPSTCPSVAKEISKPLC